MLINYFTIISEAELFLIHTLVYNCPLNPKLSSTTLLPARYVVKTLDNAESVKLQYRSLAKVPDDPTSETTNPLQE